MRHLVVIMTLALGVMDVSSGGERREEGAPEPLRLELRRLKALATMCGELPVQLRLRNVSSTPLGLVWPGRNSLASLPRPSFDWSVIVAGDVTSRHEPGQRPNSGRFCGGETWTCMRVEPGPERIEVLAPGESIPLTAKANLNSAMAAVRTPMGTWAFIATGPPASGHIGIVRIMAYYRIGRVVLDGSRPLVFGLRGELTSMELVRTGLLRSDEASFRVLPR